MCLKTIKHRRKILFYTTKVLVELVLRRKQRQMVKSQPKLSVVNIISSSQFTDQLHCSVFLGKEVFLAIPVNAMLS